jgi:glyoxylase-like metal-dependent hydrolase (beta-lactamase superfamily II)
VAHPKGTLIWDTGLPDELVKAPQGTTVMNLFTLYMPKTLAEQLKEIGYAPDAIDYMGISHMHFDHVANSSLFTKATLLMQKEEYDAAFGPTPDKFGFDPKSYPTLHKNPVKTLQGDHDVFGDGSVTIKRTLGHTPGHQALYVKLPKAGNVLLSGDLVHFTENWEKRYVPSFNFDKAVSVQTMTDVEKFLKDNRAMLWIQHDLEQNAAIKHSPAYYE